MTIDNATDRSGILVLGAGELGMAVLKELAAARRTEGLPATSVLLRPGATPNDELRDLGVGVVEADLAAASVEELADVFAPFSQVICCSGFVGGQGTQRRITEAVLLAGVDHYIPWQFGVDYDVVGRGSGQAVWDEQLDVRDMLRGQDRVRWTIVSTGIFTSFVFLPEFGIVDLERRRVSALGRWDHRLTATTPEDIGRVTAMVAADPVAYSDRIVRVAGDTFTYRQLAETVERVLGTPVERTLIERPALIAEAARAPDDVMAAYRLAFARPDGVAWPLSETLNAEEDVAMVDVATWLRCWRDGGGGARADETRDPRIDRAMRAAAPEVLIGSGDPDDVAGVARRYYASWNADLPSLFDEAVSPDYVDRTPPRGRDPDRRGLADARRAFRAAFPDGCVHVLQQIVAGDRVASHLRITGRFTGRLRDEQGSGQRVDYLATDIMRVDRGQVVENWHVEDHEALGRQIGRRRRHGR